MTSTRISGTQFKTLGPSSRECAVGDRFLTGGGKKAWDARVLLEPHYGGY